MKKCALLLFGVSFSLLEHPSKGLVEINCLNNYDNYKKYIFKYNLLYYYIILIFKFAFNKFSNLPY